MNMTLNDLKDFLEQMETQHRQQIQREMEYMMWTGESGARKFDLELRRAMPRMDLEKAIENKLLTLRQQEVIREMIESDDPGNIQMAGVILETKLYPNREKIWQ